VPTVAYTAEPLVADAEVRANRRRAELIAATGALAPAVVLGAVLGLVVSAPAGIVAFAVLLIVGTLLILRGATRFTLRVVGARPLRDDELPHLQNLVDGLCPTFGVRRPVLLALEDELPNACSVGSGPSHGYLVVTTGLEAALDLIEMEGVVSHELAHLKRSDTVVSGVAVIVLAPLVWLTGNDRLLHRLVGRGRELRADQMAARAVRYPPGLHDALVRFGEAPPPRSGSFFASRRFAMSRWIWIDPSIGERDAEQSGDLDLTSVRIDALAEL